MMNFLTDERTHDDEDIARKTILRASNYEAKRRRLYMWSYGGPLL